MFRKVRKEACSRFEQNGASIRSDWNEFNPLAHSQAGYFSKATQSLFLEEEELKAKGSISMCISVVNIKHAWQAQDKGNG